MCFSFQLDLSSAGICHVGDYPLPCPVYPLGGSYDGSAGVKC